MNRMNRSVYYMRLDNKVVVMTGRRDDVILQPMELGKLGDD